MAVNVKYWIKFLNKSGFWGSEMGKGVQCTILIGLIVVSWYILNSPVNAVYFGIQLSLAKAILFGSLVTIILSVLSFFLLAINEIPNLEPTKKAKIEEVYTATFTSSLVVAIGSVVLQLYVFIVNFLIDKFLLKITKEIWQLIFLPLFFLIALFILKKFNIYPEKKDEKKN